MSFDPRKLGALCDQCPRKGQVPVPPEGPTRARFVWLGQDPGKQEVAQLRPFVGATGKRIANIWMRSLARLKLPDIPRSAIYITNTCLCLPVTKGEGEAKKAADCCAPRLKKELDRTHPDAWILAMGKWAFYALTGWRKGVGKYLGFHKEYKR